MMSLICDMICVTYVHLYSCLTFSLYRNRERTIIGFSSYRLLCGMSLCSSVFLKLRNLPAPSKAKPQSFNAKAVWGCIIIKRWAGAVPCTRTHPELCMNPVPFKRDSIASWPQTNGANFRGWPFTEEPEDCRSRVRWKCRSSKVYINRIFVKTWALGQTHFSSDYTYVQRFCTPLVTFYIKYTFFSEYTF